jgi:hypothetical protein
MNATLPTVQAQDPRRFLARLARYAADWLEDRRCVDEHHRMIDELDARGELPALLEAVGATREELDAWAISPLTSHQLLARMMERVGVDAGTLSATMLDDVRAACRCCASWKQCRRWLRDGEPEGAYRAFCPNAALLDRLAATTEAKRIA